MTNQFKLLEGGQVGLGYDTLRILNEDALKKGLHRNRKGLINTWSHIYDQYNKVWVLYDGLPKETRAKVACPTVPKGEGLFEGGTSEMWRSAAEVLMIEKSAELVSALDIEHFLGLNLYSTERCGDLGKACGWLRFLCKEKWWLEYRLDGKTRAYEFVASIIKAQALYGFSIGNGRRLERKVAEWKVYGADCLVSEKFGTMNAIKALKNEDGDRQGMILHNGEEYTKVEIHKMAVERFIDLYSKSGMNLEMVAKVYNRDAMEKGFPTYTTMRVTQILNSPEIEAKWVVAKHGVQAARAKRELTIKRNRPTHPNQLWSVDGTTIQLYAMMPNGKVVKAGYWVQVTDAATDCIIGYAFGQTETTDLVLKALRMALYRNKRLPNVVQYDGGKANLSSEVQDMLNSMNSIGLKAQPYNGKSKYVERVLGTVEQRYARLMKNFVGGNITARSLNSRSNPDDIKQMLKNGETPTLEAVLEQMIMLVEVYNHSTIARLGMSPAKAYTKPYADEREMNELMSVVLFWVKRIQTYEYRPEGLRFEVNGERLEYVVETSRGVESKEWREKNLSERFYVRYNPEDRSRIHLYDKNDKHIGQANEKFAFSAVPTKGEMSVLKEVWSIRKDEIQESLAGAKQRRLEQAALGNAEAGFELVYKDEMAEAINYLERSGNGMMTYTTIENEDVAVVNVAPKNTPKMYGEVVLDYGIVEE